MIDHSTMYGYGIVFDNQEDDIIGLATSVGYRSKFKTVTSASIRRLSEKYNIDLLSPIKDPYEEYLAVEFLAKKYELEFAQGGDVDAGHIQYLVGKVSTISYWGFERSTDITKLLYYAKLMTRLGDMCRDLELDSSRIGYYVGSGAY